MTVSVNRFNLAAGPPVCVGMFLILYYEVNWSTIVHHNGHGWALLQLVWRIYYAIH